MKEEKEIKEFKINEMKKQLDAATKRAQNAENDMVLLHKKCQKMQSQKVLFLLSKNKLFIKLFFKIKCNDRRKKFALKIILTMI